ncbi:MAG: hypothetical protein WDN04_21715 [Rhodospirillales bacterium]
MFAGADPARILCLTFTRAAAAEMSIRLQARLGGFVTLDDARLDTRLKQLLVTPSPETRARARNLFAQVLDLPGRHAHQHDPRVLPVAAAAVSARGAVVAAFSPGRGGRTRATCADRAREAVLPRVAPALVAGLAGLTSADGFAALVRQLERRRDSLRAALALPPAALAAAFRRAAGATHDSETALIEHAVAWNGEKALRHALMRARNLGSPAVAEHAGAMLGWLDLPPPLRFEFWTQWVDALCRKDGEPSAPSRFCNPKLADLHKDIPDIFAAEQARVLAVRAQQRALMVAEASAALLRARGARAWPPTRMPRRAADLSNMTI